MKRVSLLLTCCAALAMSTSAGGEREEPGSVHRIAFPSAPRGVGGAAGHSSGASPLPPMQTPLGPGSSSGAGSGSAAGAAAGSGSSTPSAPQTPSASPSSGSNPASGSFGSSSSPEGSNDSGVSGSSGTGSQPEQPGPGPASQNPPPSGGEPPPGEPPPPIALPDGAHGGPCGSIPEGASDTTVAQRAQRALAHGPEWFGSVKIDSEALKMLALTGTLLLPPGAALGAAAATIKYVDYGLSAVDSFGSAVAEHTRSVEAELLVIGRENERMKYLVEQSKQYPAHSAQRKQFRQEYVNELRHVLAEQRGRLGDSNEFKFMRDTASDPRAMTRGVVHFGTGQGISWFGKKLAKLTGIKEDIRWSAWSGEPRSLSKTIWRGLDGEARRIGTHFEKIAAQLIKTPAKSLMAGRMLDDGWVDVVFDQYPDCYRTSLILTMPHHGFTTTLRPNDRIAPPPIPAEAVQAAVVAAAPIIAVAQALPALPASAIAAQALPARPASAIAADTPPAHVDWYERPRRSAGDSSPSPQRSAGDSSPSPPPEREPPPERSGSQIGDRCFHSCGQLKHVKAKGWGGT
jgi:hypothetical protein